MDNLLAVMPKLINGIQATFEVTIVALIIGVIIGLVACLGKMSKHIVPRATATIYIEIIRGTPILVQALFLYFGMPQALRFVLEFFTGVDTPIRMDPLIAGIIICSINSGAYVAEIFRSGIQSVDKGQMEAARSLGMPHKLAMRMVILPQAVRTVLPSLGNEFVTLIKETSILSVIGVTEITKAGQLHAAVTFNSFSTYFGVAIVYFVLTFTMSRLVNGLERRLAAGD